MEVGASACVTCTIGQYSAHVTGGADLADCAVGSQTEDVAVGDGTFMEVGASACVTCTIGQYSAHATGGADCATVRLDHRRKMLLWVMGRLWRSGHRRV